ncbi:oxidoreductase activity protein [[Candida] boidinii]|nr:oxidoreductase activity protein [[Candida] boidinii]
MSGDLAKTNLFKTIKVGSVELKHRVVYSPTTRMRNTSDHVPTDIMLEYYSQRAKNNGGLIVTEGSITSEKFGNFPNFPSFITDSQVNAWKLIIDEIHKQGSFVSVQLANIGRIAVPQLVKMTGGTLYGPCDDSYADEAAEKAAKELGLEMKALTLDDIEEAKNSMLESAKKAIEVSGADFVEIHSGSGSFYCQFLEPEINHRDDKYGGSIENRSRLLLETVDLLIANGIPASKIGIRLTPYTESQGMLGLKSSVHPIASVSYILSELENRAKQDNRLAYFSFVEPRADESIEADSVWDIDTKWVDQIWKGVIMRSSGYTSDIPEYKHLKEAAEKSDRTIFAIARHFTSNPDLPNKLLNGYPLTKYDRDTFYTNDSKGYLNFTAYGEELKNSDLEESRVGTPLA